MAGMMAMAPALIGTAGGALNMLNGAPANRVQPGMNPLQMSGALFPAMASQGYQQLAGMPNMYSDTLPQFNNIAQGMINNPGIGGAIGGANGAAMLGAGAAGNFAGLGNFLAQMGQGLTPWAGDMLRQGSTQNQNVGSLMQGAQGASQMGGAAANNMFNTGQTMQGVGQGLFPAAGAILGQGFDPQNALYDRTRQQLQEQTRAGQSARGLGTSPFGAGLENKAMSDFNIDWQNNLLSRMTTGAQGAGALLGQAGNYLNSGTNMIGQAPGMLSQSSALPYQAGQTVLGDQLRNMLSGAQGAGLLLDQSGRDVTGGASLMGQAPGMMSQSSMLPYQAFNMIGGNQLGALGQLGQQGMLATQQPQQQLQDFYQLLGLGNNSAQVGNNIFRNQLDQSNTGFQQGQQQGQNLGNSLSGLGRAMGGPGGSGGGNQFMPSSSFMNNSWGWG